MDDRIALRLGALRLARRRGRVRDAAWAASRLRLQGIVLEPSDARFARDTLIRFGRALRVARARSGRPLLTEVPVASPLPPARSRRWRVVAALAAAAMLVALLLFARGSAVPSGSPEGAQPAERVVAPTVPPLRGRSQSQVAVVPIVASTPAPSDVLTATPSPTAATAASGRPGTVGGGAGTGSGGGGSGGGGAGGGGAASPTPTPTPTPTVTPTPTKDPNLMHLTGRVVDALTNKGLPNVFVDCGFPSCAGAQVTNADGYFEVYLRTGPGLVWAIKFIKFSYTTASQDVPARPGTIILDDVRMLPAGP